MDLYERQWYEKRKLNGEYGVKCTRSLACGSSHTCWVSPNPTGAKMRVVMIKHRARSMGRLESIQKIGLNSPHGILLCYLDVWKFFVEERV
jgi:hypothetical protein